MHPLSDLAAISRKTTGDVPPKLIGASTTVIGSKLYLFGGRPLSDPCATAELYICSLETFTWEKVRYRSRDAIPPGRCFHTADAWNNQLFIFGGIGYNPSRQAHDVVTLNDVHIFDTISRRWLPLNASNGGITDLVPPPKPRHSHLSSITSDRLVIIGGQDLRNGWLDDICVYDISTRAWIRQFSYPRHYGSYLSIAAVPEQCVRMPQDTTSPKASNGVHKVSGPGSGSPHSPHSPMSYKPSVNSQPHDTRHLPTNPKSDTLSHLPFSAQPSIDSPSEIHVYSNFNFSDVKRKLEVVSPFPSGDLAFHDESHSFDHSASPPCLRFPVGAIVGAHLLISGAHISARGQSFAIWALNLLTMTWSNIDAGRGLPFQSWFQACLWRSANKFLMFGNREEGGGFDRDHVRRLSSWDHVIIVDLEAFGIYQPPPLELDIKMQTLSLTALEEGVGCDYEVICDDGRRVRCSRRLLEDRWPWFQSQLACLLERAKIAMGASPSSASAPAPNKSIQAAEKQPDPRITSRSFQLSEPYAVTLALMQYFYTLSLLTPLQQAPAVLSRLLVLSSMYQIHRLQSLVKHAMHLALSESTCAGVHEVATLCGCRSLRIRAYKAITAQTHSHATVVHPIAGGASQVTSSSDESSSASSHEVPVHAPNKRPLQPVRVKSQPSPQPSEAKNGPPPAAKISKKTSKLFDRVLRATSSTPNKTKNSSPKWKTGGGRHPVVVDRAARARKIQAIEAAMNLSEPSETESESHGSETPSLTRRSTDPFPAQNAQHTMMPESERTAGLAVQKSLGFSRSTSDQAELLRKPGNSSVPHLPAYGVPLIAEPKPPTRNPPHPRPAPSPADTIRNLRAMHVVSASTENEIRSIADMLSPVLLHKTDSSLSNRENDWDDGDSIIEPALSRDFDTPVQRIRKFAIE